MTHATSEAETKLDDAVGRRDDDVSSGDVGGQCSFEVRKANAQPVIRAASLVLRKHTPPSPDHLSNEVGSRTMNRRPMPSMAALSNDRQTPWETESLGSPVDAWERFAEDGKSSRPNSENSVRRPEEELKDCAPETKVHDEAMTMKRPGFGGKPRSEVGGGGTPVVRSFSLRKLKKLDRIVTCDILQGAISNGSRLQRHSPTITAESSISKIEDEGVGAMDIEDGGQILKGTFARSLDAGCGNSFSRTPDDLRRSLQAGPNRGVVSGNSTGVDTEEEVARRSTRFNDSSSPTSKNLVSSRFLTHPPIRDRSLTREGGSMDSNGLGALRDISPGNRIEGATTQASVCSLDSHICPSEDASERVSCPSEVALDKEEEGGVLGRLDYKNSKTLKHKSKSDPSGEKNNESVDLSSSLASIGIYAQSSPILIEKQNVRFSFGGQEERDQNEHGRYSFDKPDVTEGCVSPTMEDAGTKVTLRSEESFDEQLPTAIKPPRPTTLSKRRQRTALSATFEPSDLTRKTVAMDSAKQGKSSDQDSTPTNDAVGSIATRSQAVGRGKPALPSSLTLPLIKKTTTILRSQSSVEAVDTHNEHRPPPPEIHSPTEESQSVGARVRHGSDAPEYHLTAAGSALKTIGGSVQELYRSASPRLKNRTTPSASASFSPSLDTILSQSALSLFEGASEDKDKRDFILQEFYSTEKQYVEALQMLVEKYMIPMKTQNVVDSSIVDEIFYKINEIYMHHATFITFLDRALKDWDSQSTIGDIIYKNFSKQTVIESYISFIEHFPRSEKVLDEVATKSSFQKLIEQCEKETRTKLPLKAQIVKPAQRIPRYELLIKRLLDNTPTSHPDFALLHQAERAIHELALRINSAKESKREEDLQETLKKLELLLITDLASPDRLYLRHDMVVIPSRKDQCCVWLFSDLLIISSVKRKSTSANRRTSLLLQSPNGHDFVENTKHKVWLKVPLDAVDIVQAPEVVEAGRHLADKLELESDYQTLGRMIELSAKLKCPHQVVEDAVREVFSQVNKQLSEHQMRTPPPEEHSLDVVANTQDGSVNLTILFPSGDKKTSWETAFLTSKQKLVQITYKKLPEFLQPLPITKTRAGMQFSCAAATEPSSTRLDREVLVCNSDGYVGHMCLLNLVPEPIVTLNTPVPGCNSRILCICAVPPYQELKRKRSERRVGVVMVKTPRIRIEDIRDDEEGGYVSDSGTNTDSDDTEDGERTRYRHTTDNVASSSSSSSNSSKTISESANSKDSTPIIESSKSTVWLGTEDGSIQIFASTENIKTTKSKIKVQHSASILAIVYLDQRVYVSVANGDIVVYKRNKFDGSWDCLDPNVVNLSSSTAPINRMISVNDRLWCSCFNDIIVLAIPSVDVEVRFSFSQDAKHGGINCLASQGQGVWVTGKNSSKIICYHASTYEQLVEVNIAPAVAQKLQSTDDIIRQHKMACLRITALLGCKNLLWIGTSAGIILTLPLPNIKTASIKGVMTSPPTIAGLPFGHTGHVRFLTCVESPPHPPSLPSGPGSDHSSSPGSNLSSWKASPALCANMLVISGGDGYEDFRSATTSSADAAGRDDSTNHLLLWRV